MSESTFSLDDLDHRLIALLRTDGRLPVAKLATELGVSRATVTARMERLVKTGAIAGYTVMLRTPGRRDAVRAITMVEIDGRNSEAVIRRLAGFPEIRTLYTTNGRWDVVAESETPTLREFDDLLRRIRQVDGIANTETSILLAARKELG
ncbi:MAG: Lrp/AsnC family transcriptional regulator [Devosia sp.]|uniref:Lrp/AsnC family transcriptional regulator n=1 Tax=Devosia sp. TaxID=1871048 RepID=UPI001AD02900|nr:Lrp/AsnC family transcriptional regulator [Devosia sp.]MBN9309407.1 Lrp/AsnC family transcriptional regulator [Devosia sp.]MBN9314716.1 Lrp/AsnC family transcriptional regulator [Devosia sp.]